MKKHAIQIFVILAITIIIVSCVLTVLCVVFRYTHLWKLSADFETYADDFTVLKNYIQAEFPNKIDKCLLVSTSDGQGIRLFDLDNDEYLQVPDDVLSSLEVIDKEGFPDLDANFDIIRIHKGRISFGIESGHYALVYSPDQKPSWLNSPDENIKVKVKTIGDGWYHVAHDPG